MGCEIACGDIVGDRCGRDRARIELLEREVGVDIARKGTVPAGVAGRRGGRGLRTGEIEPGRERESLLRLDGEIALGCELEGRRIEACGIDGDIAADGRGGAARG